MSLSSIGSLVATKINSVFNTSEANDSLQNNANFNAYGYTKKVKKADRWLETDTPNTIVDKVGDSVRFSDGLVERLKFIDKDVARGSNNITWGYEFTVGKTLDLQVGDFVNVYDKNSNIVLYGFVATIGSGYFNVDNSYPSYSRVAGEEYTVKELPQVVLPKAPFSPTSTDYLMDDKVHGSVIPVALAKGDIVVSGNELVTNDDVTQFIQFGGTSSFTGNSLTVSQTTTDYAYVHFDTQLLVDGQKYTIYIDSTSGEDPRFNLVTPSHDAWSSIADNYTEVFTYILGTTTIGFRNFTTVDNSSSMFSGISITAVDNIHQATEDTTAGELLTSSKFQVLTNVSRKDLVLITKTGYKTVKGLHDFAPNTSNDVIASAYGYSSL